tara:strand:- start:292 stop:1533 length:1242 start_codon:yes stop_codon:yes gene_type:complete
MTRWNLSSWRVAGIGTQPAVPSSVAGRVFMQQLSARFNVDVDVPLRFGAALAYRASRVLHELVMRSAAPTSRVDDATFIWVPLYTGFIGERHILNGRSKLDEVDAAIDLLQQSVAWRTRQEDHIIVVDMDRGRCFQSDLNIRDRFGKATLLMLDGTESYGRIFDGSGRSAASVQQASGKCCFCRDRDVVIPPLIGVGAQAASDLPASLRSALESRRFPRRFFEAKRLLASWRGDPNQSDWASPNVRRLLLRHAASPLDAGIGDGTPYKVRITSSSRGWKFSHKQYVEELLDSVFCLCPHGWAHWTPRFFEAIQTGCLPVLFKEASALPNILPFEGAISYASFVLVVAPSDVPSLGRMLHSIAVSPSLRQRQRAMWRFRARLDWTDLSSEGAFHTLWSRLGRSRHSHRERSKDS